MALPLANIRAEFPILEQRIEGSPLIYLDNAATMQKPFAVLEAMDRFYRSENANVKRGVHPLAEGATEAYEAARERVRAFLNAKTSREVVFTKNCTEAINLVARSWGEANLKKGDVVLLSLLEHHSNIVPWLQLKEKLGIEVLWIGIERDGSLKMEEAKRHFASGRVKLVALTAVSNVLGVVTPYRELTKLAHEYGALVLLDAAQLVAHAPIDVAETGCDFLAFSAHKVYGPTGIGVLYGREKQLEAMPPFLGGGTMIREVFPTHFLPTHLPEKFEAGTPPIAEAVGLRAALDWLSGIGPAPRSLVKPSVVGWEEIQHHEHELLRHALVELGKLPFLTVLGPKDPERLASCISFVSPPVHPHDLTEYIGRKGVCLRAGHHCAQPLHDVLGHPATSRLSVAVYNTAEEIDRACAAIDEAHAFFTG